MEKIPNGKYTKEFREEAVKISSLQGCQAIFRMSRIDMKKPFRLQQNLHALTKPWFIINNEDRFFHDL
jgi:hypothetical protein